MKSTIDWNEIIPRLPKELRDSLYLEAVSLLSDLASGEALEDDKPRTRTRRVRPSIAVLPRDWKVEGDGVKIGAPLRRFRLNRDINNLQPSSAHGQLWDKVKHFYDQAVTTEQLADIIKEIPGIRSTNDGIWYLWSRRCIEVIKP